MVLLFSFLLSSPATANPIGKGAPDLRALGVVWSEPSFRGHAGMIRYDGSAFRVSINKRSFWVTAAHVINEVKEESQVFISPSYMQPNGRFESPLVEYEDGRRSISNLVKVRPRFFLTASPQQIILEGEKKSLPYTYLGRIENGSGNDLSVVEGSGNFYEGPAYELRNLNNVPLKVGQLVYIAGYPLEALGKPRTSQCKFQGFTFLAGGFRGLLFCSLPEDMGGFSGGPILDTNNRVAGVLSAQLPVYKIKFDSERHNAVMLFTPLLWRSTSVDGFNQTEIDQQQCVRPIVSRNQLVVSKTSTCRD